MSFDYIRDRYGVPAKKGGRVRIETPKTGEVVVEGVITGSNGGYVEVDGSPCHPTWGAIYYEDDLVVWNYKDHE